MGAILLIACVILLWFGPGLIALWRARASASVVPRRHFRLAAGASVLPLVLLELATIADTVGRFDGFCHHAPDIKYPCSLPRAVLDAMLPSSAFALFGFLMLGALASAWGVICLLAAFLFARK
jgi:hypothetical protein